MSHQVTVSLYIHYYLKPGMKETALSKLRGIIDICQREPEFITAIIHDTPESSNQMVLYELWKGTKEDFDAIQGIKPYRTEFLADIVQYVESAVIEWNTPTFEWGTDLTGTRKS